MAEARIGPFAPDREIGPDRGRPALRAPATRAEPARRPAIRSKWRDDPPEPGDRPVDGDHDYEMRQDPMSEADRLVKTGALPNWRFWALVLGGMMMVGAAALVTLD
ncbi:hypothetical protein [Azorhizobium doebereinerae]|uniref:hypothetical protein n=1 Tax=Azorhizobium doebereinerae TaxID=281091 RepID=UPI0003F66941|nr:hypothetical protein [Azorhizobium doebereinerae]